MQQTSPPILIIDSDPCITSVMTEILADEGYAVVSASDHIAARAYLQNQLPALVLLDAWQPTITLAELRSVMRRHHQSEAPAVVTSTEPGAADLLATATRPAYLIKPFTIDSLLTCVAAYTDRRLNPGVWN